MFVDTDRMQFFKKRLLFFQHQKKRFKLSYFFRFFNQSRIDENLGDLEEETSLKDSWDK